MDKAYDLGELAKRLKAKGLNVAEDALVDLIQTTFGWVKDSAPLSATPIDDIALVAMPHLEKLILDQVDKIDGEVG